ncbi:hypothetical protein J6TS2_50590 [Heyndrickxia sporothermodurans]|nr:hypothetical protein J6TS2_50590 [Heyndrickxia sporothermodurans]
MIHYTCPDCNQSKLELDIIPKLKCPGCGKYMDAGEEDES